MSLGYVSGLRNNSLHEIKMFIQRCKTVILYNGNLVPRAFPFLSLGSREKALAPGGLLCILIGQ
jgi:hypothetical protein